MKKKTISFSLIILLLIASAGAGASAFKPSDFEVSAQGAALFSLDTNAFVYEKNLEEKLYPASLTKIMTAVLIIENTADLDSEIIVMSQTAYNLILGTESSTGLLKVGEEITARQMLYLLMLTSAGDGALAVAEHYGKGNIQNFVSQMNERAVQLGMMNTHFVNPHGLHDENHYSTVFDMVLLTKHALSLPVFQEVVGAARYQMPATNKQSARTLSTTNMLIDRSTAYYYRYANGVKTGFTDEAGRCLISTATKDGYHYLCVLMHCPVTDDRGNRVRREFGDAKALYEWAFGTLTYRTIKEKNVPVGEVPVELSMEADHVSLLLERDVAALVPQAADASTVEVRLSLQQERLDAPVEQGTILGTATVVYAGEELATVNVVAASSLTKSGFLAFWRALKTFFGSIWFKLILAAIAVFVLIFILLCIRLNRKRKRVGRVRDYRRL